LFGSETIIPSADLPCHLGEAYTRFGAAAGFETVDTMIQQATLYPYYTSFLDARERTNVVTKSLIGLGSGVKTALGLVRFGFGASAELRHCLKCDEEIWVKEGVRAWLTFHQLPAVWVCPIHESTLLCLPPQSRQTHRQILQLPAGGKSWRGASSSDSDTLLRVSRESKELLDASSRCDWPGDPAHVYWFALRELGLLRGTSQLRWDYLRCLLAACPLAAPLFGYSKVLGLTSEDVPGWLRAALGKRTAKVHPLLHLALIHALFGSFSAFRRRLTDPVPVPTDQQSVPARIPLAIHLESNLLVLDATVSSRCAASLLGIDVQTVLRVRRKLSIPIATRTKRLKGPFLREVLRDLGTACPLEQLTDKHQLSLASLYRLLAAFPQTAVRRAEAQHRETRSNYRRVWSTGQKRRPTWTVAHLRKSKGAAYAWLYRHDSDWLKAHSRSKIAPVSE
jgi:hypothetical protein